MTVLAVSHHERLEDVNGRLKELRSRSSRARDFRDAAKAAVNASDGQIDVRSEDFRRLERAADDLKEIERSIQLTEEEQRFVLSQMAGLDGGMQRESFLEDPDALAELRLRAESSSPIGDHILGQVKSKNQLLAEYEQRRGRMMAAAGDVVLPSDAARTSYYGTIQPLLRTIRLLDIVPTAPMEAGPFDILTQSYTPAAAETAELALKPAAQLVLTDLTVKAETIAVWSHISRQTLADVPGLSGAINALLSWDVEQKLETQMLSGTGTGVTITGILNTSGIGNSASATGDTVNADLVANAKRDVALANAEPNAVVMNPTDVTKALKAKASGSGERLDSDGAFGAGSISSSMWGLSLIQTPAIASGTALVGDFTRGCILYVREGISARMSDQDVDDFQRNAVKILLEGRWGFAVWRPQCFSKCTLSFAS